MYPFRIKPLVGFTVLYGTMYSAFGVASPFWPMFFESRGLSSQQLGTLLALGTLARLVAGPVGGRIADAVGLRVVLAVCATLATFAALGLLPTHEHAVLVAIAVGQAAALAPITTIADALAVNSATDTSRNTFKYGLVRGIGSAAFVIGTLVAGNLLSQRFPLSAIVWAHAMLLAGVILGATLVPGLSIPNAFSKTGGAKVTTGAFGALLQNTVFRHVIMISALIFGSHAMHDAFAVIRWTASGISPLMTSLLWSEAVLAEIAVFFFIGPFIIDRFGPRGVAAIAAIAGIVRWTVMSQTTEVGALALAQPLHGFTFALLHLACMRLIRFAVSPVFAATAQSVYAFGPAIASAVLTYFSGFLYQELGALGFLAMASLCGLAIPIALLLPSSLDR